MEKILPILIADAPEALAELCGVNLLERLLRTLQRLGFRRAIVFSSTPEIIGTELAKPSWARQEIGVQLVGSELSRSGLRCSCNKIMRSVSFSSRLTFTAMRACLPR